MKGRDGLAWTETCGGATAAGGEGSARAMAVVSGKFEEGPGISCGKMIGGEGVEMGFGGRVVAVLSKCERVSHRVLAVGLCFGSFLQHFSATSQIASDNWGASSSSGRSGLISCRTTNSTNSPKVSSPNGVSFVNIF